MKICQTAKTLGCAGMAMASLLAISPASQAATDSATINVTAVVSASSCTAGWDTSAPKTIDLGILNSAALKNKGDIIGKQDFTLELKDCGSEASAVKVTANGTPDGDGFAIDSGTDNATGVNVMVYGTGSDGTEVALDAGGQNSVTEKIQEGDAVLKFAAAVAKSGDDAPVAGKVNSSLTLNIDYQ